MILTLSLAISLLLLTSCSSGGDGTIDLSGRWEFATDPMDEGIDGRWFSRHLRQSVKLPGTMLSNGKGDPVGLDTPWIGEIVDSTFYFDDAYAGYRKPGKVKVPMWLQPDLYYSGVAWYRKTVSIPDSWDGRDISLFFERCHWQTSVWVDDVFAGSCDALGAPQTFDLTGILSPGRHSICVRMDNAIREMDPGVNSHSISDHTQGNWNGIVGKMELCARPRTYVEHLDLYPSLRDNLVRFTARVKASGDGIETLNVKVDGKEYGFDCRLHAGLNEISETVVLDSPARAWDEFDPFLYTFDYSIGDDRGGCRFGFREWDTAGGILRLNSHPVFMRGALHCGAFPLTGYPACDKQEWVRELQKCREYGLNHLRFHSWCPPEAAFEAADELGFYLQIECSSWANQSSRIGDGLPVDDYVMAESHRIVEAFGNHPSFCMFSYGNEPKGDHHVEFLSAWVRFWKEIDPDRRLYLAGASWPLVPESDFLTSARPRIQRWGEGVRSVINGKAPSTAYDWSEFVMKYRDQPVISHEIGQWCVYPNFREIRKYTGPYKARNFEIFRDKLAENGMKELEDDFLYASGRLQTLCYKADIEAALRTPRFGGFQLLGIKDFPGQGTALVGALDCFWDDKGYTSGEEYRRFCSELVPLARMGKLIYEDSDTLRAGVEVANFLRELTSQTISWKISDRKGTALSSGTLAADTLYLGNGRSYGAIEFPLGGITEASWLNLELSVAGHANDWDFWVYPGKKETGGGTVMLADALGPEETEYLRNGGSVILSFRKGARSEYLDPAVKVGFSSIFWNTAWTHNQAPHTLGILCDPSHPALAQFPTEACSNYQWQDPVSHSQAIRLDRGGMKLTPVVRLIDDWFTARPICLIAEAHTPEGGRLIISGVDFFSDMESRPAARQLLRSLESYLER